MFSDGGGIGGGIFELHMTYMTLDVLEAVVEARVPTAAQAEYPQPKGRVPKVKDHADKQSSNLEDKMTLKRFMVHIPYWYFSQPRLQC